MTSFVCCYCYKSYDNCKSFSNHMCKCNNENDNEGNGTDDNCNVADDVINDELDFQWL